MEYGPRFPRGKSDWNNYMSDYDSLYSVAGGNLILRGIVNNVLPNDTAPFYNRWRFHERQKTFGSGRLEIKARLNGATGGAWPAFWMLPANTKWPNGGEIDIMERLSHEDLFIRQFTQIIHSTLRLRIPLTAVQHQ